MQVIGWPDTLGPRRPSLANRALLLLSNTTRRAHTPDPQAQEKLTSFLFRFRDGTDKKETDTQPIHTLSL